MERPCAWKKYTSQQIEELEELCLGYKQFLSENKTERLCVKTGIKMAEEAGYVNLENMIVEGRALKAGDKVYAANHGKDLMLVNLGTAPLEQGFNILGAHVDSPRLDLKQNPAFEAGDMAYLDTHYYGGVKSYHWVASPLALVGVICKKDGTTTSSLPVASIPFVTGSTFLTVISNLRPMPANGWLPSSTTTPSAISVTRYGRSSVSPRISV